MKISQIYEGWRNNLFPPKEMEELIKTVGEERILICRSCPSNSLNKENYSTIRPDEHCTECGCTLSAKTKCLSCSCPMEKWQAVITKEQENEINNGQ